MTNNIPYYPELFECNGVTDEFSVSFNIESPAQVFVKMRDNLNNTSVELVQGIDYNVTDYKRDDTGGVTFKTSIAYPMNISLIVYRVTDDLQPKQFTQGLIDTVELERSLDKFSERMQELTSDISRAIKIGEGNNIFDIENLIPQRALIVDETGSKLEMSTHDIDSSFDGLDSRVSLAENKITSQGQSLVSNSQQISNIEGVNLTQDSRIGTLETNYSNVSESIDTINSTLSDNQTTLLGLNELKANISKVPNRTHIYYLDPASTNTTEDGTEINPYKSFNSLNTAHGQEQDVLVICKNTDNVNIQLTNKIGWTISGHLATKDGGRTNVLSVSVTGTSQSCYIIGLVINATLTDGSTIGDNYYRYCTVKGASNLGYNGYTCFEFCSVEDDISVVGNKEFDFLNSQCENNAVIYCNSAYATVIVTNSRNVALNRNYGTVLVMGSSNCIPSSKLQNGAYAIVSGSGAGALFLLNGSCLKNDGTKAPIYMTGATVAYSFGKFLFDMDGSVIAGQEVLSNLEAKQIIDGQVFQNIQPASKKQADINAALDAFVGSLSARGMHRGAVLSAFTGQEVYYVTSFSTINGGGTDNGYAYGDVVFITAPVQSDQKIKAWGIVNNITTTTMTLEVSSEGAFASDISGTTLQTTTTGNGTGCTVQVATTYDVGMTLRDIADPKEGDECVVISDETNAGQPYLYLYADRNGDGIANWIPVAEFKGSGSGGGGSDYVGDNTYVSVADGVITLTSGKKSLIDNSVQNTGAQNINGVKTFGSDIVLGTPKSAAVTDSATAYATEKQVSDVKDGLQNQIDLLDISVVEYNLTSQIDGTRTVFAIDSSITSNASISIYYAGQRLVNNINYTIDFVTHTLTMLFDTAIDAENGRNLVLIVNDHIGDAAPTATGEIYTTTEALIGDWDGKPLYRKMYKGNIPASSGGMSSISLDLGIDRIIDIKGWWQNGNVGSKFNIHGSLYDSQSPTFAIFSAGVDYIPATLRIYPHPEVVINGTTNCAYEISVEYTKL